MAKIVNLARHQKVKKAIVEMIENGSISGNKLPSEDELSKLLGVSLSTLREALLVLKGEGIISKRHGLGNFIHRSTLNTKMRIDLSTDFYSLLQDSGYEVKLTQSNFTVEKATVKDRESLNLDPSDLVISYERKFYADGKAAIVCYNRIAKKLFVKEPTNSVEEKNFAGFVWEYCQSEMAQGIFEFIPAVTGKSEKELFGLELGLPLTTWEEVFYSLGDEPICLSYVLFNPKIVKMKMLWNWGYRE